jgi:hypothetical protein
LAIFSGTPLIFGRNNHLSVDISISYVGALAREEMLRERPFIECDIARAATASPEAQWKLANLKKMKR